MFNGNSTVSFNSSKPKEEIIRIVEEQLEDIQSENPDWSSRKVNAELSKRWQELSSDDREAYEMEAVEEEEEEEIDENEI